jgi:hypothetical protein
MHIRPVDEDGFKEEMNLFDFDHRLIVQPAVLAADSVGGTTISSTLSIILTGVNISLQSEAAPLFKTCMGTIRVPLSMPRAKSFISYEQSLRAGVYKDAGARAALFLDIGGKSYKMEFPYGRAIEEEMIENFNHTLRRAATCSYTVTFLLIAERKSIEESLLVSLDTLDVVARFDSR